MRLLLPFNNKQRRCAENETDDDAAMMIMPRTLLELAANIT